MQLLSIGYPQTLTTGGAGAPTVYALPGKRCLLFCSTPLASLSQSTDEAFTANIAMTLADGMEEVSGGFIRNDGIADVEITLMPYVY
jgi:hypothetical protein